jgi:hypothetical protein
METCLAKATSLCVAARRAQGNASFVRLRLGSSGTVSLDRLSSIKTRIENRALRIKQIEKMEETKS